MVRRLFILFVAVIVFIAGIGYYKYASIRSAIEQGAMFEPPPTAVTTIRATTEDWQPSLSTVGSLKAVQGVMLSTDLAGIVSEIHFESGTEVKKGDQLVVLDARQEEASLRAAKARRELALLNLERYRGVTESRSVSKLAVDAAVSELEQAEATVEQANALIARKTIVAPFGGQLGIRSVNVGQYLNVGDPIVSLQSMDPIYVDFALPQQDLARVRVGQAVGIKVVGVGVGEFNGEITAIDSRVSEATRNVKIQGTVANPKRTMRSGMFVDVSVPLPQIQNVIALPASAISYSPYGDSVFIVEDQEDAEGNPIKVGVQHFVKTGLSRGDQVQILSGVTAGSEVVTAGTFRLQSGMPVQINNSVELGNDPAPTPPES